MGYIPFSDFGKSAAWKDDMPEDARLGGATTKELHTLILADLEREGATAEQVRTTNAFANSLIKVLLTKPQMYYTASEVQGIIAALRKGVVPNIEG